MLTLREQRVLFTRLLAQLINKALELGYEVAIDQVKRSPEEAAANAKSGKGIKNSLHLVGLAADLNLYKNGVYLASSADHKPLGEFWESLHPLNCWGGRFGDGNHYSSTRGGVK